MRAGVENLGQSDAKRGSVLDLLRYIAARGFRNLGNTCYMNVVLQVILRIPELQAYLLTDHHNRLKHRPADEVSSCCACELVDILQHYSPLAATAAGPAQHKLAESISPVGFLYALWVNSGDGEDFAGYRESDAHECLLACTLLSLSFSYHSLHDKESLTGPAYFLDLRPAIKV